MNNLYTRSWQLPEKGGFSSLEKHRESQDGDLESGNFGSHTGMDMKEFNSKVQSIETDIHSAKELVRRLEVSHEETKSALKASDVQSIRKAMSDIVSRVKNMAKLVKSKIEDLRKDNERNRGYPNCGKNTATDRHRMNITVNLGNKLSDVVRTFQSLEKRMAKEHRETVERRVFTLTGESVDPKYLDEIIDTGKSEELFQLAVRQQGRGKALDVISEMQERHDAVQEVKKSLLELHALFLDMATLVESQGELVDNIKSNLDRAVLYQEKGNQDLGVAVEIKKNTQKWVMYGVIGCIVFVAVIVGLVYISTA